MQAEKKSVENKEHHKTHSQTVAHVGKGKNMGKSKASTI